MIFMKTMMMISVMKTSGGHNGCDYIFDEENEAGGRNDDDGNHDRG